MKLKRHNSLRFLEGTSVIALETTAFELTDLPLLFLRSCLHRSGRRQARSRMWLSLLFANYVFLNAIAIWGWIGNFRHSPTSDLSFAKTQLSHRNIIVSFRRTKE